LRERALIRFSNSPRSRARGNQGPWVPRVHGISHSLASDPSPLVSCPQRLPAREAFISVWLTLRRLDSGALLVCKLHAGVSVDYHA
jgi:hypothetical protein